MIQFCIFTKMMKAKNVSRLWLDLKEAASTEEGKKELAEWDEWIKNVIEVNRPFLKVKEKAANAGTLTA